MTSPPPVSPAAAPPSPIRCLAESLGPLSEQSDWIGEGLADVLLDERPRRLEVFVQASAETVLAALPHAVVTPRHDLLLCPTASGPVDLWIAADGESCEAHLARRGLARHALALPLTLAGAASIEASVIDPYGGLADLRAGIARCVGSASAALRARPLLGLVAARLVATRGVQLDPDLRDALAAGPLPVRRRDGLAARTELRALLLGAHAGRGIEILRASALAAALVPAADDEAAQLVDESPRDLGLRLTILLRGQRGRRWLSSLHFDPGLSRRVARLLELHPIDGSAKPTRDASVKRLLRRASRADLDALMWLRRRELELAGQGVAPVDALEKALERVREAERRARDREALELDGHTVMEAMGRGPGPHVGQALQHLARWVEEDAARNTRETLLAELDRYAQSEGRPKS